MTNCIMKPKKVLPVRVIFYDIKTSSVKGIYYFEDLDEIAKLVDLDHVYLTINKVEKGHEFIEPQDSPGPGDVYLMDFIEEGPNQYSKAFFIVDHTADHVDECFPLHHIRLLWFRAKATIYRDIKNDVDSILLQIFSLNDYGIVMSQVACLVAHSTKYDLKGFIEDYEKILDTYILQFASTYNPSSIFKIKDPYEDDATSKTPVEEEDDGEFL